MQVNIFGVYKTFISYPLFLIFGSTCRHFPTCSFYARQAVEKHGFIKGLGLLLTRVLSCHPFSDRPHYDPVPQK